MVGPDAVGGYNGKVQSLGWHTTCCGAAPALRSHDGRPPPPRPKTHQLPWAPQVGAMLSGVARVHHHDGFKAAWQGCGPSAVLKHLDNDAPSLQVGLGLREKCRCAGGGASRSPVLDLPSRCALRLQEGLHAQELSGLWAKKGIVCSSGAHAAVPPRSLLLV